MVTGAAHVGVYHGPYGRLGSRPRHSAILKLPLRPRGRSAERQVRHHTKSLVRAREEVEYELAHSGRRGFTQGVSRYVLLSLCCVVEI